MPEPDPDRSGPLAGKLLVARPDQYDPNFTHTVTFIVEHSTPHGALGVVLNEPTDRSIAELFPQWHERLAGPRVLFRGGPVEPDGLLAIARPGVRTGGLALGLHAIDLEDDPEPDHGDVRIFVGYAGWGPSQLEGEIEDNAWWVVDATLDDVFSSEPTEVWARALRRTHGVSRWHAHYPRDLSVN